MKYLFILLGSVVLLAGDNLPKNPSKFLTLEVGLDDYVRSDFFYTDYSLDSLHGQEVYLLFDDENIPQIYYVDVLANVCIDGLCKPLYIELYWDLLGQYSGFGVYPDELLSKYDHEIFVQEDYEKLDRLLSDPYSKFEGKKLADFYDNSKEREEVIEFKGAKVDGISGATKKEIKESIVEGALYSCFTLWQIVNGEISIKIKDNLLNIYTPTLAETFLESGNVEYQVFAIKQFEKADFTTHLESLNLTIINASPLNRGWIIKQLPDEIWASPKFVETIYHRFDEFDSNSKTLLIKNLNKSTEKASFYLSINLSEMTKNQVKGYLESIIEITPELHENLSAFSEDKENVYGYMVETFLQEIK